jgi:hypothetical protein
VTERRLQLFHGCERIVDFDDQPLVVLVVQLKDDRALWIMNIVEDGPVALIIGAGSDNPRNLRAWDPESVPPAGCRVGIKAHRRMCATGMSSWLLNAHSLSQPSTSKRTRSPVMDTATIVVNLCLSGNRVHPPNALAQLQGQLRQDTERLNRDSHGRHERWVGGTCQL